MENHRGEIISKLIEENGVGYQEAADRIGISRTTLYRWLNSPVLSLAKMNRVATVFDAKPYTFSKISSVVGEKTIEELDQIELKDKYLNVLEQHNKLMMDYNELKNYVEALRNDHPEIFTGTKTAPKADKTDEPTEGK